MSACTDYSVYCIALDARRPHAEAFARSMGYHDCIFPPVVLRDNLNYRDLVANRTVASWMGLPYPSSKGYMGKVACSMSHANVLRAFLASGKRAALVLEDDNRIPDNPAQTRKRLEAFLRVPGWEFINLSPCFCDCLFSQETTPGLHKATGQCTSAYLVRPEGAKAFLDRMFPLRPVVQIALDTVIPRLPNAYEARPRLFEQNEDTASTNGNNFVSRLCFVTWKQVLVGVVVVVLVGAVVGLVRQKRKA